MTEWLHFHFSLSCIGEGNGNPLWCSCLEDPRDGEAWWAAFYGVAQSQTRLKRLSSSSSSILLLRERERFILRTWSTWLWKPWSPFICKLEIQESPRYNSSLSLKVWGPETSGINLGPRQGNSDVPAQKDRQEGTKPSLLPLCVLCRPSRDWMMPTHTEEALYFTEPPI